ncbi:hypothetical protein ACJX0J_036514, partial [Zea mays]
MHMYSFFPFIIFIVIFFPTKGWSGQLDIHENDSDQKILCKFHKHFYNEVHKTNVGPSCMHIEQQIVCVLEIWNVDEIFFTITSITTDRKTAAIQITKGWSGQLDIHENDSDQKILCKFHKHFYNEVHKTNVGFNDIIDE